MASQLHGLASPHLLLGSHLSVSSESDTLTFTPGLATAMHHAPPRPQDHPLDFTATKATVSLTALPHLRQISRVPRQPPGEDPVLVHSRMSTVPRPSDRQQRIEAMLRDLTPFRYRSVEEEPSYSSSLDHLNQQSDAPSGGGRPEPAAEQSAGPPYPRPLASGLHSPYPQPMSYTTSVPSPSPATPVGAFQSQGHRIQDLTPTALAYESAVGTPPVPAASSRAQGQWPPAAGTSTAAFGAQSSPSSYPLTQPQARPQSPSAQQHQASPPAPPDPTPSTMPATTSGTQPTPQPTLPLPPPPPPQPPAPDTAFPPPPVSHAVGFHFGQQQVYVSGPPMHQQLQLHPDGTVTTIHSPYPPTLQQQQQQQQQGRFEQPLSPRQAPDLVGGGQGSPFSPLQQQQLALLTAPGQAANSDATAKYKRAKKLLQGQVYENDSLRQQLVSESKRVAVLEARLGAIGSPAELSNLLASTQADRLVAMSKLQEASAQLEVERGNNRMLQAKAASAELEKQTLVEAFIREQAKREAEALSTRRGLEAQLEDAMDKLSASHSRSQVPAELSAQVLELQLHVEQLQGLKQAAELELEAARSKLASSGEDEEQRLRAMTERLSQQHEAALSSLQREQEAALAEQQQRYHDAVQRLQRHHMEVLDASGARQQQALAELELRCVQSLAAAQQAAAGHEEAVEEVEGQLRREVEGRQALEATVSSLRQRVEELQAEAQGMGERAGELEVKVRQQEEERLVLQGAVEEAREERERVERRLEAQAEEAARHLAVVQEQLDVQAEEAARRLAEAQEQLEAQAEEAAERLAAVQERAEELEAELEEQQQVHVEALELLQAAHVQGMQQLHALHGAALKQLQLQQAEVDEQQAEVQREQLLELEEAMRKMQGEYEEAQLQQEEQHQQQLAEAEKAMQRLQVAEEAMQRLQWEHEEVLRQKAVMEAAEEGLQKLQVAEERLRQEHEEIQRQQEDTHRQQVAEAKEALQTLQQEREEIQQRQEEVHRQQLGEAKEAMQRLEWQLGETQRQQGEMQRQQEEVNQQQLLKMGKSMQKLQWKYEEVQRQQADRHRQHVEEVEAMQRLQWEQGEMYEQQQQELRQQLVAAEEAAQRLRWELNEAEREKQQVQLAGEDMVKRSAEEAAQAVALEHKEALRQQEAAHRVQLGDAREAARKLKLEHEEALRQQEEVQSQQLAEAERMMDLAQKALQKMKMEHEAALRQQAAAQSKQLADAADAVRTLTLEHEAALRQQGGARSRQLADAEDEVWRLKVEHEEALERQVKVHRQQLAEGAEAVRKLRLEHEEALQQAKGHSQELAEGGEAMRKLHEEALQQQAKVHSQQVAEAEEATRQLALEHQRALQQQAKVHREELAEAEQAMRVLRLEHEETLRQQVEVHGQEVSALKVTHQGELTSAGLEHQGQVALKEQQLQQQLRGQQQQQRMVEGVQGVLEGMLEAQQQARAARLMKIVQQLGEADGKAAAAAMDAQAALTEMSVQVEALEQQVQAQLEQHAREVESIQGAAAAAQDVLRQRYEEQQAQVLAVARDEVDWTTAAAEGRLQVAEDRALQAEKQVQQMALQVQGLELEVQELQDDLDASHEDAEQCAEELEEVQEQLRLREEELVRLQLQLQEVQEQLRLREEALVRLQLQLQESQQQAAGAQQREMEACAAQEAAVDAAQQLHEQAARSAQAAEAAAEQQQLLLHTAVRELRAELQQLSKSQVQQKLDAAAGVSAEVQECRAELASLAMDFQLLSHQSKAATATSRALEQETVSSQATPAGQGRVPDSQHTQASGSTLRDAAVQASPSPEELAGEEVVERMSATMPGLADKEQELQAERLLLKHMLTRVASLEVEIQGDAGRPLQSDAPVGSGARGDQSSPSHHDLDVRGQHQPASKLLDSATTAQRPPAENQALTSKLAADFHRALDDIAQNCSQMSSITQILCVLEVYSAAMGSPASPRQQLPQGSAGATLMQSLAAVSAAAAAAGVTEAEVEQMLSPIGLELMLGYQQVMALTLTEFHRVQGIAAAAVAALAALGAGDEADSALSEAVRSRLVTHRALLGSIQLRITQAVGVVKDALAMQARSAADAGLRSRASSPAGGAAACYGPGRLAGPGADDATRRSTSHSLSSSSQQQPTAWQLTPVMTSAAPAGSPLLPGSSPPLPRQWAWPRGPFGLVTQPIPFNSLREHASMAAAPQSFAASPPALPAEATSAHGYGLKVAGSAGPGGLRDVDSSVSYATGSNRSGRGSGGVQADLGSGTSRQRMGDVSDEGGLLLEKLINRRRDREQRMRKQQQQQQQQGRESGSVKSGGGQLRRELSTVREGSDLYPGDATAHVTVGVRPPSGPLDAAPLRSGAQNRGMEPRGRPGQRPSMQGRPPGQGARVGLRHVGSSPRHVLGAEFGLLMPAPAELVEKEDRAEVKAFNPAPVAHQASQPHSAASKGPAAAYAAVHVQARDEASAASVATMSSYAASFERQQRLSKLKSARQASRAFMP